MELKISCSLDYSADVSIVTYGTYVDSVLALLMSGGATCTVSSRLSNCLADFGRSLLSVLDSFSPVFVGRA